MIFLELILGFLQVGCFAFGGAYGAIPLIRDVVLRYGWLTDDQLTYMIAISESTPGPIMVNLATYVGSGQGGFWGAVLATLAVVLPSFVTILLIMVALNSLLKNGWVQALLRGLKPCVIGIILATGVYMVIKTCFPAGSLDLKNAVLTLVLGTLFFGSERIFHRKWNPIVFIAVAAVLGMAWYAI